MLVAAVATGLALVAPHRPQWRPERRVAWSPTCLDAGLFVSGFSSDAVDLFRQGAEGFAIALPHMQQGVAESAGPLLGRASQELVSAPVIDQLRDGADGLARVLPDIQEAAAEAAAPLLEQALQGVSAAALVATKPAAWAIDPVTSPAAEQVRQGAGGLAQAVADLQQALTETAGTLTETAESMLDRASPELIETLPMPGASQPGELTRALTDAPRAGAEEAAAQLEGVSRETAVAGAKAAEAGQAVNQEIPAEAAPRSLAGLRQSMAGMAGPLVERASRGMAQATSGTSAVNDLGRALNEFGRAADGVTRAAAEMQSALAGDAVLAGRAAPAVQRASQSASEQAVAFDQLAGPVLDALRLGAAQAAQAVSTLQQQAAPVLNRAAQQVSEQAPIIAAKVAAGVGAGIEAAAPVVRSQLEAMAQSGFEAAAPLVESGLTAVRSGLTSTSDAAGTALSQQLTPEQLAAAEQAGRVASKLGKLAGTAARGAIGLGAAAVTAAAPVAAWLQGADK
jgi:hypothetical protein